MLYIFSVLPTPEAFIKQFNTIIYNFLWKGPDKVARPAVMNELKYGGLNLMDVETSIKSLRLAWFGRLFVERSSLWQASINHLLVEFSYSGAIMTLMNIILIHYFTKNSFSGGLILEQNFPQSLQSLNILYGIIRTLKPWSNGS